MRIGCSVNFKKESLQVADYLAFFQTFVPFQPKSLSTDQGQERDLENEAVDELVHKIFDQYFIISGNGGSILSGVEEKTRFIDLSIDPFRNTDEDILGYINRPGFMAAYLYDSDYVSAQNTKMGKYIVDDSSLKDTPFLMSKDGYKVYDTSYNPGREEELSFTTLLPACKMWFGEAFFEYIPKEKVLTFPHAVEVAELSNGIVYVHLFENISDSNSVAARAAQWAWRHWLDFEGLIEKY